MLLRQSHLCIPGDKHLDFEYRQMKKVRSKWQTERRVSNAGRVDRETGFSKKRKVESENRAFNQELTDWFCASSGKNEHVWVWVYLICSETVALIQWVNVKRHYETKHKVFDQTYPLKSELRSQKISSLEPNMKNTKEEWDIRGKERETVKLFNC